MKPLASGERQQSCDGPVGLAKRAETVAGILTRPRVCSAKVRKQPPGSGKPTVLQVAACDMCQLVGHDESYRCLSSGQRQFEDIGVEDDEVPSEEPRRERIQQSTGLDDVYRGHL